MARVISFRRIEDGLGVRLLAAGWAEIWPGAWNFPCLCRGFWVLYRNDRDGAWIEHDGVRTALAAGRAYLIPAWRGYRTGTAARLRHFYCYFEVRGQGLELLTQHLPGAMAVAGPPWLDRLAAAAGTLPGAVDQARLVALAVEALGPHLDGAAATAGAGGADAGLAPALERMAQGFRGPLRVAELAALCGLGDDAFTRRFRAAFATTPVQHLRRLRVQEAARLLLDSDHDLAHIAAAVGLGTAPYLARVFRSVTAMSPAAWRRQGWRQTGAEVPT